MEKRSEQVHSRESSATLQLTVSLLYQKPHLGFVKRNKKVIMILKHISGMLCLLISYSKFTRPGCSNKLHFYTTSDKIMKILWQLNAGCLFCT